MKTVLFDMDGTLLNMGESTFENEYIKRMVVFLDQRYPGKGKEIVKAVGYGGEIMKQNDGSRVNMELFWEAFESVSEYTRNEIESVILEYYQTDFTHVGDDYVPDKAMQNAVRLLDAKGYQLVVATTPVIPLIANEVRVRWCGLSDIPWIDITSFETYNYSKPNLKYYQQICDRFNLNPEECLMVGDSLVKDFPATELGMDFFLILNEDSPEAERNFNGKKGDRTELLEYVKGM